jgi:succinyl-diaminopimelate desuccinylase
VKPHPVMGGPTVNVGTFEGGQGVNMVPDEASIGVDIRTVAGMDHKALLSRIKDLLGKEAELQVFSDMNAVWTEPGQEWVQRVFEICARYIGERPAAKTASYNTDAGNLLKVYVGAPTVVLGPGEPQLAHQTDEYCSMARIGEAVAIYEELICDWCGL